MITASKAYITNGGCETVWSQPPGEVIKKLNDCIRLNEEYQRCFHKTKEKLEKMPNERPFEFSEMYIFGKFDTFTKRLKNIIAIFDMFSVYATLSESKIEGMFSVVCLFCNTSYATRLVTCFFSSLKVASSKMYWILKLILYTSL
jgi:dynein heavy chain